MSKASEYTHLFVEEIKKWPRAVCGVDLTGEPLGAKADYAKCIRIGQRRGVDFAR